MLSVFTKLYGSAVIARNLRGQRRFPYIPRRQLDELRDRRVREMVRYAARYVPFYREMFERVRIDPKTIRTAADMDRLPILDREQVRAQPRLFMAQTREARKSLSFLTSGSTGTPIDIHHDRHSLLCNIPYGERERDSMIKLCGGSFRPSELYIGYETSTFKKVIAFYDRAVLFPVKPIRKFVSLLEPIETIAQIANEKRPDILIGYGGWIDLFFKTVAAKGIKLHPPRIAMYIGEALPHGARQFIEEKFSVAIMSRYNAVESFKIGFFCEARTGFHIHEDICHVRIVDDDGKTAPLGVQGRVIISNLINRATILLNYPIGDVATLQPDACPCGRSFRLLSELEGRVEDLLPLPDGRTIHPRAVWQVFKDFPQVLQYQLTQQELTRFDLKLVTADENGYQQALVQTIPVLQNLLGVNARIETSRRTEFNRDGRKFRAVASLCSRNAT